jgi:hypothetical protein
MDLLLRGEAFLDDIDDYVDDWHERASGQSLAEYLGMAPNEYALWVEQPDSLRLIVAAREEQEPVEEFVAAADPLAIAARGVSAAEARTVVEWLRATGRLPT